MSSIVIALFAGIGASHVVELTADLMDLADFTKGVLSGATAVTVIRAVLDKLRPEFAAARTHKEPNP